MGVLFWSLHLNLQPAVMKVIHPFSQPEGA